MRKPQIARRSGVRAVVFNPNGATRLRGTSICIGALLGDPQDWHRPGSSAVDGSYALLRSDSRRVELVADPAGTRTIWYTLRPDSFIASTSQRAIVSLLGEFEPNRRVIPWVLSSGTLGPFGGWDSRLKQLAPGERLVLDRQLWSTRSEVAPVSFEPAMKCDRARHGERLADAVADACAQWPFDPSKWVLPLSGGVDSRGLLMLFRSRAVVRTITWGLGTGRYERNNDAQIASEVAAKLGVENRFFSVDLSSEPRERLLQRFLVAGEGRVAKISGYLDGFAVWKTLCEEGIDGIIRGDEAFGSMSVRTDYEARFTARLTLLADYFDDEERASFELADQTIPESLLRRPQETLATWRDRLYQQFRVPVLLAGLTDLKAGYVEVANPLLAGRVLDRVRTLPDSLRTGKRLWRELVDAMAPNVAFASRSAVLMLSEFLADAAMRRLMLAELESARCRDLLGPQLQRRFSAIIRTAPHEAAGSAAKPAAQLQRAGLSGGIRAAARRWVALKPTLQPMELAFRAFIVCRMHTLLKADADALPAEPRHAANL